MMEMEYDDICAFWNIPDDPRSATKHILGKLQTKIHPFINKLRKYIQNFSDKEGECSKINEVYSLCLSQITKSLMTLFDIFRLEHSHCTVLQESRQCHLERLSRCLDRLKSIKQYLDRMHNSHTKENANESFNETMHFVNWIDHTFDNLNRLSELVYKKDFKEADNQGKVQVVECISGLHISIDELLLCAMTLCRYCLAGDQLVIKARCKVVLRETKALLSELVQGDVDSIKLSVDTLKHPIMPSNVNLTIDVLKDVLYALETNTNAALLALIIHCFSNDMSPLDVLKEHSENGCACADDCEIVKEFDLYDERLLQIGSFAISCSSDQNRILSLRSGLASIEALDPHLVPALMTSPRSLHSTLLIKSWRQEVKAIRDSVFVIVDPAPFAEKSKQVMRELLLEALKSDAYRNSDVCSIISVGCVLLDFFNTYIEIEPDALTQREKLMPLLSDLEKVLLECKIVSNLLCTKNDFTYKVKTQANKPASLDQLYKRIKLLYTIVSRISSQLTPSGSDHVIDEEEPTNVTHTIAKNGVTYVNSPIRNTSRSMFARTNVRSSTRNVPIWKLTKRRNQELNFSVKLDELNLSDGKMSDKRLDKVKLSAFNLSPIQNRSSLRKVVLNRHLQCAKAVDFGGAAVSESLFSEYESLQLTEVLNEINNMTSILSTPKSRKALYGDKNKTNILLPLDINNQSTSKYIWNTPVKNAMVDIPVDESLPQDESNSFPQEEFNSLPNVSNLSQPSNVTTLERIFDLDFVHDKLNSLKSQETRL